MSVKSQKKKFAFDNPGVYTPFQTETSFLLFFPYNKKTVLESQKSIDQTGCPGSRKGETIYGLSVHQSLYQ